MTCKPDPILSLMWVSGVRDILFCTDILQPVSLVGWHETWIHDQSCECTMWPNRSNIVSGAHYGSLNKWCVFVKVWCVNVLVLRNRCLFCGILGYSYVLCSVTTYCLKSFCVLFVVSGYLDYVKWLSNPLTRFLLALYYCSMQPPFNLLQSAVPSAAGCLRPQLHYCEMVKESKVNSLVFPPFWRFLATSQCTF